jgi:predicted kinase
MKKILSLFILLCFPLFASEGKLIVLYGTACAGKSTLAKALEEALPGHFQPVKRTKIAHRLKKEHRICDNSSHMDFKEMALPLMIREIEARLANGENLIFDVCLYKAEQLDKLSHLNPVYILVYAPIRDLSLREQQRSRSRGRSLMQQESTRKYILSGFTKLYQPAVNRQAIDTLSKEEVMIYIHATRSSWGDDSLSHAADTLMTHFHLHANGRTGISPKRKPTLLIDTSRNSLKVNVEKIKQRIASI